MESMKEPPTSSCVLSDTKEEVAAVTKPMMVVGVRDAVGRGGGAAQVPPVQKPRVAALPPCRRHRRQHQQTAAQQELASQPRCLLSPALKC
ncbi:hypothetical protein ZWY2020_011120 [Hordeum vulgare]|nr:hypothetical protein ZWY2020_011120 [Hordeum vulgare]